jgi:hypothetical protein
MPKGQGMHLKKVLSKKVFAFSYARVKVRSEEVDYCIETTMKIVLFLKIRNFG